MDLDKLNVADWLKSDVELLKRVVASADLNLPITAESFRSDLDVLREAENSVESLDPEARYRAGCEDEYEILPGSNEALFVEHLEAETRSLRLRLIVAEKSEPIRKLIWEKALGEINLQKDHVAPMRLYAVRFDLVTIDDVWSGTYPALLRQLTAFSKMITSSRGWTPLQGILYAPEWLPLWMEHHRLLGKNWSSETVARSIQLIDQSLVDLSEKELLQSAVDMWDSMGPVSWNRSINETISVCRKIWRS